MEMTKRLLNTEEASYTSSLDMERLKKRVAALFEHNSLRLAGRLRKDNAFTAHDQLTVVNWAMPNLRRKSAYLRGEMAATEQGTLIKLTINPNSILPISAVAAILIGMLNMIIALSNTAGDHNWLLLFGIVFLAIGIIYYPMSTLFRNRLRNKIVKHLDLQKV